MARAARREAQREEERDRRRERRGEHGARGGGGGRGVKEGVGWERGGWVGEGAKELGECSPQQVAGGQGGGAWRRAAQCYR